MPKMHSPGGIPVNLSGGFGKYEQSTHFAGKFRQNGNEQINDGRVIDI